jgi:hypothetical protein
MTDSRQAASLVLDEMESTSSKCDLPRNQKNEKGDE